MFMCLRRVYVGVCVVGLFWVTLEQEDDVCSSVLLGTSRHSVCPHDRICHHDIKTFVPVEWLLSDSGLSRRTLVGRKTCVKAYFNKRTLFIGLNMRLR